MSVLFRYLFSISILLQSVPGWATEPVQDWRQSASMQEKVQQLTRVAPGASTVMLQMGARYRNLYWAGKLGKWKFAEYQLEEMQELIKTLMITRPGRAASAEDFTQTAFRQFPAALKNHDWNTFSTAFEHMRTQCMVCHARNKHVFITLPQIPARGNSPVLDTRP